MSCNGCRILRRGCNENCILRESLDCIDAPLAQSNATLFVAKFFGRAALLSFLSSVPPSQRPALFHSLLLEACGRTLNPVTGAVGLLWTGNWHLCQSAADTVLRGGAIRSLDEANNDNDLYYNIVDHGGFEFRLTAGGISVNQKKRPSDHSQTTTVFPCNQHLQHKHHETKLLHLFS